MLCDEHAVQRLADRCQDPSHSAFLGGEGRCQMFYRTGVCRLLTRLNEAARSTRCAAGTTLLLLLPPTPDPFGTQSHKHRAVSTGLTSDWGGGQTRQGGQRDMLLSTNYCPSSAG